MFKNFQKVSLKIVIAVSLIKNSSRRSMFNDTETIQKNATSALSTITKTDFRNCFKIDYFEGFHEPDDN